MILLYYLTRQKPRKRTLYEFNDYSMVYPLPTKTCSALLSTGRHPKCVPSDFVPILHLHI
jgi:hypothetical protein